MGRARHANPPHHRLDDQFELVVVPSLCDWPSPLWEGSVAAGAEVGSTSGVAESENPKSSLMVERMDSGSLVSVTRVEWSLTSSGVPSLLGSRPSTDAFFQALEEASR